MCAHGIYGVSGPAMEFIGVKAYDSDGSSGANSPAERAGGEVLVEHGESAGILEKVTRACEELKRLKAMCSKQERELKCMEAKLGEAEEELRETKKNLVETKWDLRTQQERTSFLNQVVGCDRPARSIYLERYKAIMNSDWMTGSIGGVDMISWKANAAADALIYLENIRDDSDVFWDLYGMSWEGVLGVETAETMRVINTFAHSRVARESTPKYREAVNNFYRLYWSSSQEERLVYPSQTSSRLRLAYNVFWREYRKLGCAGYGFAA